MRETSSEETLQVKEFYKNLSDTHRARVCAYSAYNEIFAEPLFNKTVQTCVQQIRYCRVESHHQNAIVERIIKELTLGIRNLLLHESILWPEAVSIMPRPFSF